MTSFFSNLLMKFIPSLLSWAGRKISSWFSFLREKKELKKGQDQRKDQAVSVEQIAAEIQKLIDEGKPVPEELKEKLRQESRKLIRKSSNAGK